MHTSDPFDSSASMNAPCPKCGWQQSPTNESCAACGLIFARFHAARARPVASSAAMSSSSSRALVSSMSSQMPVVEERAATIVGAATSSSSSVIGTLFGLHVLPALVLSVVGYGLVWYGAGAIDGRLGLAAYGAQVGRFLAGQGVADGAGGLVVGTVAVLAAFVVLVTVVLAGVTASSTIVVDEHMRTGDDRGFSAVMRDGFGSALPVAGVFFVVGVLGLVPVALTFAVLTTIKSGAVSVAMLVVGVGVAVVLVVRSSLAVPAVVLGERGIVDALRDSWALTAGRTLTTLGTVLLGGAVAMVIGGVAAFFTWIPVLGVVLTVAANAIGNGIASGVAAGMWRARSDG